MKKIVVFISGQGSTLQALIDGCGNGRIHGRICAVISDKSDAFGLNRAEQAGIPTQVFVSKDYTNREAMDLAMAEYVANLDADLILLAGYMRMLSPAFTKKFVGKILNIHPSLLPKYPGLDTYNRALQAGDSEHGTTVHFVNDELDAGAIVLQAKVPIFAGDEASDIEQRVKYQEQQIYPLVANWFVKGRLQLIDGRAYLDNQPLPETGYGDE